MTAKLTFLPASVSWSVKLNQGQERIVESLKSKIFRCVERPVSVCVTQRSWGGPWKLPLPCLLWHVQQQGYGGEWSSGEKIWRCWGLSLDLASRLTFNLFFLSRIGWRKWSLISSLGQGWMSAWLGGSGAWSLRGGRVSSPGRAAALALPAEAEQPFPSPHNLLPPRCQQK